MRVLVCGGRDFTDREHIFKELDKLDASSRIEEVIHGAARGADSIAGQWARERGRKETPVRAEWDRHGRGAGPIRNSEMLKLNPDFVVAFPGGYGTRDMIYQARGANVRVLQL